MKGSLAGEVLPCLGQEKLRLGEGVLRLGELGTTGKCCFSCYTILCAGWFLEELLAQKGLSPVIRNDGSR